MISATQSTLKISWMLLSLLVLGSGGAIFITALYVKTLQEKRASQVDESLDEFLNPQPSQERVKSLLRVVAEQSEMRPSLTSLTSFTSNIDMAEVYANYHRTPSSYSLGAEKTESNFKNISSCI